MTAGEIIPESVFDDWGIIQPEDGGYFEFDSFTCRLVTLTGHLRVVFSIIERQQISWPRL